MHQKLAYETIFSYTFCDWFNYDKFLILTNQQVVLMGLITFLSVFLVYCIEDSVYMEESAKRDEYVMNETSLVFCGTKYKINHFKWQQGQVCVFVQIYMLFSFF